MNTLICKSLLGSFALIFVFGKLHAQTFGKGEVHGVTVTGSSNSAKAGNTLKSTGFLPNEKAASRFLSQATLGTKWQEITDIQNQGIETWLDQQLTLPYSFNLQNYVQGIHQYMVDSLNARNNPASNTLANTFIDDWAFDIAWFQGIMTASDRLRWRISLALSQIFVTSRVSAFDNNPYALASYYDMLNRNAFTTYRSLLDSITYHPTMAVYLTYMNNHATDTTDGRQIYPDENYAREIMQLFSIGLHQLNANGTEKKAPNGNPIPTYNNEDIAGLAKVFTGLSWHNSRYLGENNTNLWSYTHKLKFFPMDSSDKYRRPWVTNPRIVSGHEPGPKTFLGSTIPARPVSQGQQDISDALNILSNHPNVGPFIARRLIQHLVTSNPTPEYIGRVSAIFNNNGSGGRGDLKAVIRAVLLDPEARDCCIEKKQNDFGHLREPLLRYTNLVHGLNLQSSVGIYRNVMEDIYNRLEQRPLNSPSVFNFYQPDYTPDGPIQTAKKVAPEFQMLNSLSYTKYLNGLHLWIIQNDPVQYWNIFTGETTKTNQDPSFDLSPDFVLARDNRLTEFLDKYNLILAQGRISTQSINLIKNTLMQMPMSFNTEGVPDSTLADRRLRMGIFLIMMSPEYVINR